MKHILCESSSPKTEAQAAPLKDYAIRSRFGNCELHVHCVEGYLISTMFFSRGSHAGPVGSPL